MDATEPKYQRLTDACDAVGIKRSQAFKLVRQGMLDTFRIGRTRFVYIESLRTLPERLAKKEGGE
jgi:hypothetical protein